jgi:hypothetical protein
MPSIGFWLILAGGIVIVLAGLAVAVLGASLTFSIGGIGGALGPLGMLCGLVIVALALALRSAPSQHAGLGAAVIMFSLLSWIGSYGGFVIGFLLALAGGILAIFWRPHPVPAGGPTPER